MTTAGLDLSAVATLPTERVAMLLGVPAHLLVGLAPQELTALLADLPEHVAAALAEAAGATPAEQPPSPLAQALSTDPRYRVRSHLRHVSDRLAVAVADVEAGTSRRLIIEMPPRTGKTMLTTQFLPLWLLGRHPEWDMALVSHDPALAASWGRQIRRWVEDGVLPGVGIAPDAGAVQEWETTAGGTVLSRSLRGSLTGRGARVLLIDDPHKDAVEAHSATERDRVWNWWLSVAQTRLEPPSLVVVIQTRWHEDDLAGRLLSPDTDGDPVDWERIRLPALADDPADPLGRALDEPLLSPLVDETPAQAAERWATLKRDVGSYMFAALFQQRPAPSQGAIFDTGWWRFHTTDPARVTDDGRVVLTPDRLLTRGHAVESWDMAFKGTDAADYVVGQRWARLGPDRYLIDQVRGRWSFTETLAAVRSFTHPQVPTRLVEDKANGTAVLDTLRQEIDGLVPVSPRDGKEARARAITPEVEAGNVYLPHPADPGAGWVGDLLSELRDFPHGAHDDQCDALTQALSRLRTPGRGSLSVPGAGPRSRRIDRPSTGYAGPGLRGSSPVRAGQVPIRRSA